MHSTNRLTLSKQSVDRLPVADREIVFWDQHLPGFGVRVYPEVAGNGGGVRVYGEERRAVGAKPQNSPCRNDWRQIRPRGL